VPVILEGFLQALQATLNIVVTWWWVVVPFVFGSMLWNARLYYVRIKFLANLKWVLLEIIVPQDVLKTPLAMEQVLTGMHSALFPGNWWTQKIGGRLQEWYSLEITSFGGDIHFYIYTVDKFRNMVESYVYAQYPDAEIFEAEDYTQKVPWDIPNKEYDLTGAELVLKKEDAYPIRVWRDFEFETKDGEANVDPLAGLIENLSSLSEGEQTWIQIGIKPVGDGWKKEGEEVISKLIGRKLPSAKKGSTVLSILSKEVGDFAKGATQAPFKIPEYDTLERKDEKKEEYSTRMMQMTPGEREVVEAIEKNIAKVGFESVIRIIYISKGAHNNQNFFSAAGAFGQLGTQNLNRIGWNRGTLTYSEWPLPWPKAIIKSSERFRRKWLIYKYRFRYKPEKPSTYSVEELATMFHFPGRIISTPALPRIETQKGKPPLGLPIV